MAILTEQERATLERLLQKERKHVLEAIGTFDENTQDLRDRAGEMSVYRLHPADVGSEAQEQEKDMLLASKEGRRLYQIDDALRRLYADPETFGSCLRCGKPVGYPRLEVIPEAPYCSQCQAELEAGAAS